MAVGKLKRLLDETELDKDILLQLFDVANTFEHSPDGCMKGKILKTYTDEPSTRTMDSSHTAAIKLGGQYIHTRSQGSSEDKDESFEDTIVTLASIGADILAIRHHDEEAIYRAAARVAQLCPVPIVNCGSGGMHHPTQAGGDVYAIQRTRKEIDGLKIAFVGGIDNSRAVNSLAYLLTKWDIDKMYLVAPDHLQIKGSLRLYLHDKLGSKVIETSDLDSVLGVADIFYQSRIQWNHDANPEQARLGPPPYIFNYKNVSRMQKHARIMHPWPRNKELLREVDLMPQQMYIKEMYYATLFRMALFANMVG